jgi:hypothetical protein
MKRDRFRAWHLPAGGGERHPKPGGGAGQGHRGKDALALWDRESLFRSYARLSAARISLAACGSLQSLREGPVISAILVGYIILGFSTVFNYFHSERGLAD